MRRRLTRYSLLVSAALVILFSSFFALTYELSLAQDDGGTVLLPFVAADGSGQSLTEETAVATPIGSNEPTSIPATDIPPTNIPATDIPPTATPTATPAGSDNSVWDPPPSPTPTPTLAPSYPEWIVGSHNMRIDKREGWGEFRDDGTFSERWSTFGTAGTRTYDGTWFVNDGRLFSAYTDHNGDFYTARFLIEQTEGGLRLMGGDHKLGSILFERAVPVDAVGSYAGETVPISRWMRGRWSYISGITSYQIVFDEGGRYKLYQAQSYIDDDELPVPFEMGQWGIWADQMTILPDGETLGDAHTYAITSSTRGFIQIQGGRFGAGDVGLLRKRLFPPSSMWAFEGQYLAGDVTLTIEKDGNGYRAQILDEGVRTTTSGTLDENNHLILQKEADDTYDPISPHFNALHYGSYELPEWLIKVSETARPLVTDHLGMWIIDYTFTNDSELWLLPDGRYLTKSGSGFEARGTYTIANGLITYDPVCGGPYSREIEFVDNQMIQKSDGTVFTYHHVPEKLGDIMAAMAASDQREGRLNAAFAATHQFAPRDPTYITAPIGDIVTDLFPNDVYADATVFAGLELYFILFPLATYSDQLGFYFFPNGRYQFYSTNFVEVGGGVGQYETTTAWGKYKVEDEKILLLSDAGEEVVLELALGRRRAMWGESCLDHIDWVSDNDGLR